MSGGGSWFGLRDGGEGGEDGVDRRAAADASAGEAVGGRQAGGVRRPPARPLPRHSPGPPRRGPPRDGNEQTKISSPFLLVLSWIHLVCLLAVPDHRFLQAKFVVACACMI